MHLAVAGSPIAHSLSPVIHTAALADLGEPISYGACEVTAATLPAFITGLRSDGWLGANLTHPLKRAVLPLLDDVGAAAARLGAVNTVVARGGRLTGMNTDGAGFVDSLRAAGLGDALAGPVALLGGGGAACAVADAVAHGGALVHVIARRPEQAEALLAACPAQRRGIPTGWVADAQCEQVLSSVRLLVDCTPLGTAAGEGSAAWTAAQRAYARLPLAALPPEAAVCDLTYRPRRTALLALLEGSGRPTLDGLEMLIAQAARSLQLWLGRSPSRAVMRAAALEALAAGPASP